MFTVDVKQQCDNNKIFESASLSFYDTKYLLCCRDRDVPGLDTVVPLETTAAYDIRDVITGVRYFCMSL